jgi:putative transposase
MPRSARIVIPDVPHHVTQRGNNKQAVFNSNEDREKYLALLSFHSKKNDLTILGYCLMDNHVHLIVLPEKKESLSRAIGQTHFHYTRFFNERYHRTGHLWQNRFYSCALDTPRLGSAMRYVERNPVRSGLCRKPWNYPWSSASIHTQSPSAPSGGVLDRKTWNRYFSESDWKEIVDARDSKAVVDEIRAKTRNGHPWGSRQFILRAGKILGRKIILRKAGRPPKKQVTVPN